MGVVYKARQVSIDRIVAIKMLNQQMARDPKWVARFNQEAKACSRLQHPNTIRMFEFGQTKAGQLFMSMEFLDGPSLQEAIVAGAPMAPVRVLKILIQCCASLAEAHGYGIVHRDIKPDNVFLLNMAGSPDFVKLLDFSVAKLLQDNDGMRTQAGVVFGTPQYMSPEQGRGAPLDARSDLYALGILAYEMLTGKVPFNDHNPMLVLQMHLRQPVPPLPSTVPKVLADIVMQALDKNPHRRSQSATEMMQVCQHAFAQLGAHAGGIAAPPPMAPVRQASTPVPEQTVMAPVGGVGGAPPPAAPRPVYGVPPQAAAPHSAPPQDKTMMAGMGVPAPPQDKTMLAGMAPNLGQFPGSAPPGMGAPGMGAPGMGAPSYGGPPVITVPSAQRQVPGGATAGPKRTMLLDATEGIVSLDGAHASAAQPAAAIPQSAPGSVLGQSARDQTSVTHLGGPSPLFWLICLGTGLAIGVLAYIAVLKLGG